MTDTLEPCPHCGPMPAHPEAIQDHLGYWRVICGPCGSSSGTLPEGERWPDARQRVIDGWNKRHGARRSEIAANDCQGEDPIAILVARLRQLARQQAGELDGDVSWSQSQNRVLAAQDSVYWSAADTILSLSQERDRLRAALEFYAAAASWETRGHPQIDADTVPTRKDCGQVARAALGRNPAS